MVRHKLLVQTGAVIHRVAVLRRLTAGQGVSVLPVRIAGNTFRGECGLLPRSFDGEVRVVAVLLQEARLVGSDAGFGVVLDPASREGCGVNSPALGIHVEGPEVQGRDVKILDPRDALGSLVRVRCVSAQPETFVAKSHHVLRVE